MHEPAEIRVAFQALAAEVGPKADVYASVAMIGSRALNGLIYTHGICARPGQGATLSASADTWDDLLTALRGRWEEHSDLHAENAVKAMAAAVIRLTYQLGECTDAALRAEFDAGEVDRFGERACERANVMAERGPFSITRTGGANAMAAAA